MKQPFQDQQALMEKRRKYTFDYDSAVKQKLFGD